MNSSPDNPQFYENRIRKVFIILEHLRYLRTLPSEDVMVPILFPLVLCASISTKCKTVYILTML